MTNTDIGGWSAEHIHIAAGTGVLARRDAALLFVPEAGPGCDDLLAVFAAAETPAVVDAVTDALTDGATTVGLDVEAFVLVSWADELHMVVLGAVELHSDHPSMPMLSGAGSGSWVERRLRLGSASITVHAGAAASPATDLQLGRVAASGFSASFSAAAPAGVAPAPARSAPRPAPPEPPAELPVERVEPAAVPPVAPPPPAAPADPTGPIATDRLAALRAAMRGPSEPVATTPSTVADGPDESAPGQATAAPTPIDDEVTLAPEVTPTPEVATVTGVDRGDVVNGGDDQAPFVAARRCGRGHLNPPHLGACRTCGDLLDAGAPTEQVRQPPLAVLDLGPDTGHGGPLPIDRALVLGRRPDAGAAQTTDRARLVPLADDASVSRTHLRIDVEDWTLTVTDCGSRSGTAIVSRPGEEPRILEPWLAHELPIGARLFLGGPTSVVVRPAGDR